MTKKTATLLGLACFFGGMVLGILCSPLKGGIGNNSGNTTINHYGLEEETVDEEESVTD